MKDELLITKQITDIIIKICLDIVEFSKLYKREDSGSVIRLFQCNDDIKKGLKWFIGSQNRQDLYNNIGAYIKSVKTTLRVYENLNVPFKNKEKMIEVLINLHSHLIILQKKVE